MRDEEIRLLFQALSQILTNQDDIKKRNTWDLINLIQNMVGMTKIR